MIPRQLCLKMWCSSHLVISPTRKLIQAGQRRWYGKGGVVCGKHMACVTVGCIILRTWSKNGENGKECKIPVTCYVAMEFLMASKSSDRFYLIHKWNNKSFWLKV